MHVDFFFLDHLKGACSDIAGVVEQAFHSKTGFLD
jgi:hypothetical protein